MDKRDIIIIILGLILIFLALELLRFIDIIPNFPGEPEFPLTIWF